jgi:hypothetical protein
MGPKQAEDQARVCHLQLADQARHNLPSQPLKPKIQVQLDQESKDHKGRNESRREKESREKINEKRRASKKKSQSDVVRTTGYNLKKGQE